MTKHVKNQFDYYATEYDKSRRNYIPDFDNFYSTGIRVLSCGKAAPRVLDVGGGTGIYTSFLLDKYPGARVTLIDFSRQMLDEAEKKYAGTPDIDVICDDYLKHDYGSLKYDIIISALSVHHFDEAGKRAVYEKMYSLLDTGGEFLNADEVNYGEPALDKTYLDMWKEFVKENATADEYENFLSKIHIDIVSPMQIQLEWLKQAGFSAADCVFKLGTFAVMYAKK